jgi:hypothetical protein
MPPLDSWLEIAFQSPLLLLPASRMLAVSGARGARWGWPSPGGWWSSTRERGGYKAAWARGRPFSLACLCTSRRDAPGATKPQ